MLRQICRRGRLSAVVQDHINNDNYLGEALRILFPVIHPEQSDTSQRSDPMQTAQHNSRGKTLRPEIYDKILALVNTGFPYPVFRHRNDLPHPPNTQVLPPLAVPINHIECNGRGYSVFGRHPGNSSIAYRRTDGSIDGGFITAMWSQILQGTERIFIEVAPHKSLSPEDAPRSPYISCEGLRGIIVYDEPSQPRTPVIIQRKDIRGHLAGRRRPPGTFGINKGIIILVNSLTRGRE